MYVHVSYGVQEVLDADEEPLRGKNGEVMIRDIVQFVPLRQFQTQNTASHDLVGHMHVTCMSHVIIMPVACDTGKGNTGRNS